MGKAILNQEYPPLIRTRILYGSQHVGQLYFRTNDEFNLNLLDVIVILTIVVLVILSLIVIRLEVIIRDLDVVVVIHEDTVLIRQMSDPV
jgi:hypothetical protein